MIILICSEGLKDLKEPFEDKESLSSFDDCRFEEFGSAVAWTGGVVFVIFGTSVVGIEPVKENYSH